MKWILLLAIFVVISLLSAWISSRHGYETLSAVLMGIGIVVIALLIAFSLGIHSERKKSEIAYAQLAATKSQIEQAFLSDNALAQAEALKLVVDYNATVTKIHIDLERPIVGELYSKKVDWSALEMIDWAANAKGE